MQTIKGEVDDIGVISFTQSPLSTACALEPLVETPRLIVEEVPLAPCQERCVAVAVSRSFVGRLILGVGDKLRFESAS